MQAGILGSVSVLVFGLVLVAEPAAAVEKPVPGCFAKCMQPHKPTNDDYFSFSGDVKACRDRCDAEALEALKATDRYAAYAKCTPQPLSKQEFRDLRASNPSWQAQFNVFTWEIKNIFPDKILTRIEVRTQDMNLIDVDLVAETLIPPGESGTFVVADFFDGYPAVRYATKVTSAFACPAS